MGRVIQSSTTSRTIVRASPVAARVTEKVPAPPATARSMANHRMQLTRIARVSRRIGIAAGGVCR